MHLDASSLKAFRLGRFFLNAKSRVFRINRFSRVASASTRDVETLAGPGRCEIAVVVGILLLLMRIARSSLLKPRTRSIREVSVAVLNRQ